MVSSIHEMEASETTSRQGLYSDSTSWHASTNEGLSQGLTLDEKLQAINGCLEKDNQYFPGTYTLKS